MLVLLAVNLARAAATGTTGDTGTAMQTADTGGADTAVDPALPLSEETADTGAAPASEDPEWTYTSDDTGPDTDVVPVFDTSVPVVFATGLGGEVGGLACDTTGNTGGLGLLILLLARRRGAR